MVNAKDAQVSIFYKNWRYETSWRTIVPIKIWHGSTEWHKNAQWLLTAHDVEKDAERDFALNDISIWRERKSQA